MQPRRHLRNALAGLVALLFLLSPTKVAWSQDAACNDVAERGHLTVLTINLLFSEIETRPQRLADIAAFAAAGEVDLILLQEVVGGALAKTASSARDLQRLLRGQGLVFELRSATEVALPGLLSVGNATLSRCDIVFKLVKLLPPAPEAEIGGQVIELLRNVLMTRIDVPGFGRINAYNTHLCAFCPGGERETQLEQLLEFVNDVERFLPGEDPIVLGGDFNLDIFRDNGAERPLYDSILAEGFTDAYAAAAADPLEELCEDPTVPDEHCTFGASALSVGSNARRIDYIFTKNFGQVLFADVVFNPLVDAGEPTVSDHSGVVVRVALPGAGPLM